MYKMKDLKHVLAPGELSFITIGPGNEVLCASGGMIARLEWMMTAQAHPLRGDIDNPPHSLICLALAYFQVGDDMHSFALSVVFHLGAPAYD